MHLTDLMVDAGVIQNAFGRRGLAGVNMRRNTDVAVTFNGGFACHGNCPGKWLESLKTEMGKGFVGFGHAMHLIALLHGAALAFGGIEQLTGQTQGG